MRIAIVNDVLMAVEALRRIVTSVPDYQVAWIARDGAEAVNKCAKDTPDVILMDLMMPVMDGAEATRRIMRGSPCAILVVTATVEGHSAKVFEAMGYGALDAVNTPVLGSGGDLRGGGELLAKIAVIGKLIGKKTGQTRPPVVKSSPPILSTPRLSLIAIGSSTGGPKALAEILAPLPARLGAAIVIVQHVDVEFAPGLASWLDSRTVLHVCVADEGQAPGPDTVLIAATNDHLVLKDHRTLGYRAEPHDYPYRPSVDVFFESVVTQWSGRALGILLTGMGRDGAKGLLSMRQAGWHTLAQDKTTSVVYGMPKAAAELGAAVEVLPVGDIASAILRWLARLDEVKQ